MGEQRERGAVVAIGSRSVVRVWDDDSVVKVPNPTTPPAWIRHEAEFTAAVWALGVPTHRPLGPATFEGRPCSRYEWLEGPTMWSLVVAQPHRAAQHGRQLAELHARLLAVAPPVSLPRKADRLGCKLRRAASVSHPHLGAVAIDVPPATATPSLCHGDFHPGNVIVTTEGPMVVDWFDACRGEAAGDVARTSLLLGAGGTNREELRHLPGATPGLLRTLHDAYVDAIVALTGIDRSAIGAWRRIEALARVAEGVDPAALAPVWGAGDSAQAGRSPGR